MSDKELEEQRKSLREKVKRDLEMFGATPINKGGTMTPRKRAKLWRRRRNSKRRRIGSWYTCADVPYDLGTGDFTVEAWWTVQNGKLERIA